MTKDKRQLLRRAFTLVEAMISIALALVLILAVARIFGIAQETVGAGTTILTSVEKDRGAMAVFTQDVHTMVAHPNSPGIVLYSAAIPAFRNIVDKTQDLDGNAWTMNLMNSSGTLVSGGSLSYTQPNDRIHRIDKFCFFARDQYTRQTADSPNITNTTTSSEAFIWYGHLALPNNANPSVYMGPGAPTTASNVNDNNLYASSWILGREVILLLTAPNSTTDAHYFTGPPTTNTDPLSLLAPSKSQDGFALYASRYDLAATSIDSYKNYLYGIDPPATLTSNTWWENMIGYNSTTDVRYQANPFPIKPTPTVAGWMSTAAAETYPIFIKGCSQFLVEFAGDFVGQNSSTGQVTTAVPDGQIDFTVDPSTGGHKIRWYGFPRDPADEGQIGVVVGPATGANGAQYYDLQYGVCPLRDTLILAGNYNTIYPTAAGEAPVERIVPAASTNYASLAAMTANNANVSSPYVCAWGQDTQTFPRPKMIRITFAIDDPDGHLNAAQTYSFVYNLP